MARMFVKKLDLLETVLCFGTMIVNHLVDYAGENSATGKFTTIGGISAKGKEPFYEKIGFEVISNGIKKMIEIKQTKGVG